MTRRNSLKFELPIFFLALLFSCPVSPAEPVRNLSAAARDREIKLAWENPTEEAFAYIRIYRSRTGYPQSEAQEVKIYQGRDTRFIDTSLANGVLYYYSAFAYDGVSGRSPLGNTAKAKAIPVNAPPNIPSKVQGSIPTDTVVLTWSKSYDASGIAGYNVYRNIAPDGEFVRINDQLIKENRYADDIPASPGSTYYYRISAVEASSIRLESPCSPIISVSVSKTAPILKISPNPFDPKGPPAKISYSLAGNMPVTVEIYDLVAGLVWEGWFKAGQNGGKSGINIVEWNGADRAGTDMKNGLYSLHVIADNGVSQEVIGKGKIRINR